MNLLPYEWEYDITDQNVPQVQIIHRIPPGSRVLDVGCAGGRVAKHLTAKGCEVVGLDRDPILAEKARQYCGQVIVGDAEDEAILAAIQGPFDYVVLADVLEHLVQPELLLTRLKTKLKICGRILTAIPNVLVWETRREFLLGRFDYQEYGILDRTHLRFFTWKTARMLPEKAGYRLINVSFSHNIPIVNRLAHLMRGCLRRLGLGVGQPWLHTIPQAMVRLMPGLFANHFVLELGTVDQAGAGGLSSPGRTAARNEVEDTHAVSFGFRNNSGSLGWWDSGAGRSRRGQSG